MCGDYDACEITSDTCFKSPYGIYEATCGCGQGEACEEDEICSNGTCLNDNDYSMGTEPTNGGKLLLLKSPSFRIIKLDHGFFNSLCVSVSSNCSENEFSCNDGACIDKTFLCDEEKDCSDWEDEDNCEYNCNPEYQFKCTDGSGCISILNKCDGYADCNDKSDEDPSICTKSK